MDHWHGCHLYTSKEVIDMSINFNSSLDYTTLFNSLSSGNSSKDYVSSLSNIISDYSSIKNGSYGKIVSAYYAKAAGTKSAASTSTTTAASVSNNTAKAYASVAKDAQNLQSSAETLSSNSLYNKKNITTTASDGTKTTAYGYDTKALYNAVSDFADKYNTLLASGSASSGTNIATRTSYLSTITKMNESALKEIGITKDSQTGKLSVNEASFNKADISAVQKLFASDSGYAYQISSASSLIESAAGNAVSASSGKTYTASGTYSAYQTGTLMNSTV